MEMTSEIKECSNDIGNCPCATCRNKGHGIYEIHCRICTEKKGWKMYAQDFNLKPLKITKLEKLHFTFE